jgi:sulfur-carrier protein
MYLHGMTQATVRVRFFASYAEALGQAEWSLNVVLPATVRDVVNRVRDQLPGGRELPEQPLAALNRRHVKLDAPVASGDEVAFLPPLAGG